MLIEVKVPVLAESVPDATLLDWYKKEGEAVERGENLIDLETDKVTLEVAAPETGVIKELKKQTGDVVLTDDVLAVIDTEAKADAANDATAATPAGETGGSSADTPSELPRFGPAVRKLLDEHKLDPAQIPGTGKDGRLTKADVVKYIEQGSAPEPESAPVASATTIHARTDIVEGVRPEERIPMTRLRKRTAERLLNAQHSNAILTTFNEVNMQPVMELRNQYKDEFEKQHGVRLGFMSIFVKAAVEALKKISHRQCLS